MRSFIGSTLFLTAFISVLTYVVTASGNTDCQSVLPAICKLNGPGSHCHPCAATAYILCSDDGISELRGCDKGHTWDALLSHCKPDTWVQPRHAKCEPGKTIQLPKDFKATASSAAAVTKAAATAAAAYKGSKLHGLLARANAAVKLLSKAAANPNQAVAVTQQSGGSTATESIQSLRPAHQQKQKTLQSLDRATKAAGKQKGTGRLATAAVSRVQRISKADEAQVQLLHTALLDVKMLRQKAANMNAEASLAEDLAEKQAAAVKAVLDDSSTAAAAAEDVEELQERVAIADQAMKTAEALRQEAEALLAQSQVQAAAAAQQLAALTEGASMALGELLSSGHDMLAADFNSLLSLSAGAFDLGGSSNMQLKPVGVPETFQQQQQQQQQQPQHQDSAMASHAVAEGSDTSNDDYSLLAQNVWHDAGSEGGVQAALDLATAAKDVLQHLIAEFEANSGNSLDQISDSLGLDPSQSGASSENAVSNEGPNAENVTLPQTMEGPLTWEQLLSQQGAGSIDQTEDISADEEAIARGIIRQNMLELADELNIDEADFFKVDEESPNGFPIRGETEVASAGTPKLESAPQQEDNSHRQQQEEQEQEQQYWKGPQQPYWEGQKEQYWQGQLQPYWQGQEQQQQQTSSALSDSLDLATKYHTELVRAASELARSASPVVGAKLQSVKPVDTRTDTQIQLLELVFAAILDGLQNERRATLMSLEPKAAFALVVGSGAPIVALQPRLTAMLRPTEAAQLQDVLTVQLREISKDMLAQVHKIHEDSSVPFVQRPQPAHAPGPQPQRPAAAASSAAAGGTNSSAHGSSSDSSVGSSGNSTNSSSKAVQQTPSTHEPQTTQTSSISAAHNGTAGAAESQKAQSLAQPVPQAVSQTQTQRLPQVQPLPQPMPQPQALPPAQANAGPAPAQKAAGTLATAPAHDQNPAASSAASIGTATVQSPRDDQPLQQSTPAQQQQQQLLGSNDGETVVITAIEIKLP